MFDEILEANKKVMTDGEGMFPTQKKLLDYMGKMERKRDAKSY